jgi:hypothetical protein
LNTLQVNSAAALDFVCQSIITNLWHKDIFITIYCFSSYIKVSKTRVNTIMAKIFPMPIESTNLLEFFVHNTSSLDIKA